MDGVDPVLGAAVVATMASVVDGAATVSAVVELGTVVDAVDCAVVGAAVVDGALVVDVVAWLSVLPEVSETATDGPAGGVGASVVDGVVDVVAGRMTDAVSTGCSSRAGSAVDTDGIDPSSATCWLRAFTAW